MLNTTVEATPQSITDLIRSVNIHVSGRNQFTRFKNLYKNDRIAFVYDILPIFAKSIANYQEEILGYFDEGYTRISVRSPHGVGKTTLASIMTHHSVLTADTDCKVPTTASAWRQLEKYLWPEIKKTCKFLEWTEIGRRPYTRDELLVLSIKLEQGTVEAFAVASDDHTTIEGAHATRIVYIFDEAKTIPRATWDAAEGAFSSEGLQISDYERGILSKEGIAIAHNVPGQNEVYSNIGKAKHIDSDFHHLNTDNNMMGNNNNPDLALSLRSLATPLLPTASLSAQDAQSDVAIEDHRQSQIIATGTSIYQAIAFAISTPGDPSGQFYDIHIHRPGFEDWKTRHVTVDEAIAAGRISRRWVDQRAIQWGIDSSVFQNRVLGEFADNTEEGVIPLSWIRAANVRWEEWRKKDFTTIGMKDIREFLGVDVARSGEDKTVIAYRIGCGVQKLHIYSKLLTTQTAGNVKVLCANKRTHIEMDGGLGASVYDMLREQDVKYLVPITVGAGTYFKDKSGELGFLNVRAAMWWHMRELLDPIYNNEIMLPPIEELTLDLSTPRWEMMSHGVIRIESKENIAKRIGRSTDYGDAVCLAFWEASTGGGVVF